MLNRPKTIEEARKYKYGHWAGNPSGNKYDENDCAYEVWEQGRVINAYQCSRKNGYGPEGLYCKQHAKMVEVKK